MQRMEGQVVQRAVRHDDPPGIAQGAVAGRGEQRIIELPQDLPGVRCQTLQMTGRAPANGAPS